MPNFKQMLKFSRNIHQLFYNQLITVNVKRWSTIVKVGILDLQSLNTEKLYIVIFDV